MTCIQATLLTLLAVAYAMGQNEDLDGVAATGPEKLPAPPPSPLDECDPEMIGFELITGNVFSAPGNVLDSIPGTLMLTDCLETCQGNESCQSVNYETGLCVLFSANADILPGNNIDHILLLSLIKSASFDVTFTEDYLEGVW
ncbi:hypothetical protein NQ317_002355 [Molorchus minor]|uniref:Apple domain-containing protein n=1 Tax=Molorchus minor TaxID=1323400 RepID=A0ABQ9JV93_9CUCU|nr:hypothetical protein NQ317_002355 [Molorchus minor]